MVSFSPEESMIIYSSLLHDIGKFFNYSRGSDHTKNGKNFVKDLLSRLGEEYKDKEILEKIGIFIGNHHPHTQEARENKFISIIYLADKHTSEQRVEEEGKAYRDETLLETPMNMIKKESEPQELKQYFIPHRFSSLIKEIESHHSPTDVYKLIVFSNDNEKYGHALSKLKNFYSRINYTKIRDSLANILKVLDLKNDTTVSHVEMVLMDFLAFIPSDVIRGRDLSLYNHLKSSSALSLSMFRNEKNKDDEKNKISLIVVNIGGIQNFLFSSLNDEIARKGATKRFRGRSLFVTIVTNLIEEYIRRKLFLPYHNTLVKNSGMLIIMSNQISDEEFSEIKENILRFEFKEIFGNLEIRVVKLDVELDELYNSEKFQKLQKRIRDKLKYEKYMHASEHIDVIYDFNSFDRRKKKVCEICGNLIPHDSIENKCKICKFSEFMGARLPKKGIGFYIKLVDENIDDVDDDYKIFELGDMKFYVDIINKNDLSRIKNSTIYLKVSEYKEYIEDLTNGRGKFFDAVRNNNAIRILWEDVYVPVKETGEVKELDEILDISQYSEIMNLIDEEIEVEPNREESKSNKLSMIYLDVDNGGKLFFCTPKEEGGKEVLFHNIFGVFNREANKWTIERFIMLSTYLNIFFSIINRRVTELYDVYTIFSGGDDLRVIGHPLVLLSYLNSINENFLHFFDFKLSYSSAFGIFDKNIPLITLNNKIKEIEGYAKSQPKKSSVCVNNKEFIIQVDNIPDLYMKITELKKMILKDFISSSMIYNILKVSKKYVKNVREVSKNDKIYVSLSLIEYIIRRNVKSNEELNERLKNILLDEDVVKLFPIISAFVLVDNDKLKVMKGVEQQS